MAYIALYRKWRPQILEDVVGQPHITLTLKNQLTRGKTAHAYIFAGPRGTGKTSTAKILAKALNCTNSVNGEPCNKCSICTELSVGAVMDVIEIDAASNNGVNEIRELRQNVKYPPTTGKFKVYIIDEVHMLSIGAFNALLKTLEEPPEHAVFILATTEPQKIPATILSRCQRFDFRRLSGKDIKGRMLFIVQKENIQIDDNALEFISKLADGALRDALSILDQCIAVQKGGITYDHVVTLIGTVKNEILFNIVDGINASDTTCVLEYVHQITMSGKDNTVFIRDLIMHFRDILIVKSTEKYNEILALPEDMLKEYECQATKIPKELLIRAIKLLSTCESELKRSTQSRALIETLLIELCQPELDDRLPALLQRISKLEHYIEQGFVPLNKKKDARDTKSVKAKEQKQKQDVIKEDNRINSEIKGNESVLENQELEQDDTASKSQEQDKPALLVTGNEDKDKMQNYDFNKFNEEWTYILQSLKKTSIKLFSYLTGARLLKLTDKTLVIGVEKDFYRSALEMEANRKLIQDTIQNVTSYVPVYVHFEVLHDEQIKQKTVDDNSIYDKAISLFGKDKVEVID